MSGDNYKEQPSYPKLTKTVNTDSFKEEKISLVFVIFTVLPSQDTEVN